MSHTSQSALQFSPFHIPANVDLLYREEKMVALERRAVQVLRYLVEHHDRVVSKDELLEAVWPDTFISDGVLKRAVSQARRALGDVADKAKFIETYHGRGYRFVAKVERQAGAASAKPEPANQQEVLPPTVPPVAQSASQSMQSAAAAAARSIPATAVSSAPDYNQLAGRETEMAQLQADYRRTLEGVGQPVLLIGEPGIGKTQLAREFANRARAQGAACLYAQFFDYQASRLAPYEVFLDLIRSILGVNAGNREDCDLRVLARNHFGVALPEELFTDARINSQLQMSRVTGALMLDDASPYKTAPLNASNMARARSTGPLSTVPLSASPRGTGMLSGGSSRAVAPIGQCFIRASHHRPLVMILDDVQWADEASREVIGHLMRVLGREPLMIVCLARAEALLGIGSDSNSNFTDWIKRLASSRSYTTLTLKPLDEAASRAAIDAVFGGGISVPPADLQTLHRITSGNPYFLVEMLRLLVAEKAICFDSAQPNWQWRGIKDLSLPVTIVMAAQAKLDRLSDEVREMVESAAVIGDEFRIETLARVTGHSEDEIERLVLGGVRRGVLAELGVSTDNDVRFHHTTLRRVLYDALPLRRRKRLHLRAAQALEAIYAFEQDRVAEAISAHYEAATDWGKTFEWSIRAWQAASSRLSWSEAMIGIERAERAAKEMAQGSGSHLAPAERLKLLFAMGETNFAVGNLKESDALYNEAVLMARATNDRTAMATALLQQGQTRMSLALYQESVAVTELALELYRAMDDQEGAAMALLQLGGVEVRRGNYDAAIDLAQKSLEDVALNSQVAAIAFGLLGWARALQGHFTEGVPLLERALDYLSSVGDVQRRALLLRRSHWAELSRGRYEAAIDLAMRARDDAERLGDAAAEATMEMGIGQARLAQGLHNEAIEFLTRARERLHAVGDTHCEAETLWLLGRAQCELGDPQQARTLLEKALAMILEVGDRDDEFRILTDLARVSLGEGDAETALQFAENAQVIAEELNNRDALGTTLVEIARSLLPLARYDEALAAIERALALLEETESGERWRAYWAKAQILEAQNADSKDALTALSRTVGLLDDIRQQVSQDEPRFAAVTKSRCAPAQQFHAMLLRQGQTDKAQETALAWSL
ncbi:MAG: tetratricopeptide repeat protein [Acidobacteriota bacterium]